MGRVLLVVGDDPCIGTVERLAGHGHDVVVVGGRGSGKLLGFAVDVFSGAMVRHAIEYGEKVVDSVNSSRYGSPRSRAGRAARWR